MKKALTLLVLAACLVVTSFGAIVTNTNQSAAYLRMLSRNASMDIDAVYYNPAGVVGLADGFHIALHNQTIWQDKTVVSAFPFLNADTFEGKTRVPVYPNVYAVYRMGKLAFSFGFGPNAGGGSADYAKGLPSFEKPVSLIPLALTLAGLPTTQYSADIAFNGSSVYYGGQFNVAYAISDMFSLAAGVRYIYAKNTYEGHIKDILVNAYHPILNPGRAMIPAVAFTPLAANREVDAEQTGSGFTPILSLNVRPMEALNISLRYEFNTKLELTNKTAKDDVGMFPDGEKNRNDIPAILAAGVQYAVLPQLRLSFSYSLFFEKNANWEGLEDELDGNSYDLAVGLEYDLTEMFTLSAGYQMTKSGAGANYQTDTSFDLSANAFGAGARIKATPKLDVELGVFYAAYTDDEVTITYLLGNYTETFKQTTFGFALGLGYHF